jgi:hypothetical protein
VQEFSQLTSLLSLPSEKGRFLTLKQFVNFAVSQTVRRFSTTKGKFGSSVWLPLFSFAFVATQHAFGSYIFFLIYIEAASASF